MNSTTSKIIDEFPWKNDNHYNVSIIVPTFNRAEYLEECLNSLLEQTVPAKEIIVIDDGSEDNTSEVVRGFGDRITYIYQKNAGKAIAANLALTHVKGNLIWLFDDDDVALPSAIESRINTLKSHPSAGFVYSPHYLGLNNSKGSIIKSSLHRPPSYHNSVFLYQLLCGCFFHLASTLVRVEAFKAIGGFDIELLRSQDYDMQIRLARRFSGVFSPTPSFIFRQHPGLRGSKSTRHTNENRSSVFIQYDQIIGEKIYSNLQLEEYLTPQKSISSALEKREALLGRMVIMASKGCIEKMFEDLITVLELPENRVDNFLKGKIISAITTGYTYKSIQSDWPRFKQHIYGIKKYPRSRSVIKSFAKGFFILAKSYPGGFRERATKLRYSVIVLMM